MNPISEPTTTAMGESRALRWANNWPAFTVGGALFAAWTLALFATHHNPDLIRFMGPFALCVIAPLALLDCGVLVFYWVRGKEMTVPARLVMLLPLGMTLAAVLAADGL